VKPSQLVGELADGGGFEASAIRENADRKPRIVEPIDTKLAGLVFGLEFHELERHIAAMKKVADRVGASRVDPSIDFEARTVSLELVRLISADDRPHFRRTQVR
jgi:hypothetical protein